jgi:hypothetical protein
VIVVAHDAPSQHYEVVSITDLAHGFEKKRRLVVFTEDPLTSGYPVVDVVDPTLKEDARRSRHSNSIAILHEYTNI